MQELDEILKKIERYIEIYQMPPLGREVEGTVELLKECRNVIRKHMANRMYEKNTEIIA